MRTEPLDLEALLHPSHAYAHPRDVLRDPDLTTYEKRAILASWASDACAVDAAPALRQIEPGVAPVQFDDIMDALQTLDASVAKDISPRERPGPDENPGPRSESPRHV